MTQIVPPTPTASTDRPDRADRATFSVRAAAWADWIKAHLIDDMVALANNAFANALDAYNSAMSGSASAAASSSSAASSSICAGQAAASANFKGSWSALTGAAAVPYSVYHSGTYWMLLSNVADITAKTPGVAAEWAPIIFSPSAKFSIERSARRARQSTFA